MGSFYREELLCAMSAHTRRALVTDLLSYSLWISQVFFPDFVFLRKSNCCCNISQIPAQETHTYGSQHKSPQPQVDYTCPSAEQKVGLHK